MAEWLERAFEARDPFLLHLGFPDWDSLRSSPGFRDLWSRLELPS